MLNVFNKIKNQLIIYFIFITFLIKSEPEIYNYVNNKLMQIWTNIDLIRAINSTEEQKKEFAKNIFKELLIINKAINLNLKFKEKTTDIKVIKKLIRSIISNFNEVFNSIDIKESILISFILNKILLNLKYPIYINPQIASNHTSIKYPLSSNAIIIKDRYKRI